MNQVLKMFRALQRRYGDVERWSARSPYEVIVGAVLTQNTAWRNVERALANFRELTPQHVNALSDDELRDVVRPAGFYRQKAAYLRNVTAWFARYGCDAARVKRQPLPTLRAQLLAVSGVGCETADSILLYAFGLPTFVVDAYTKRLCARYPVDCGGSGYAQVQAHFADHLPRDVDLYDLYHTYILRVAKEHCRKRRPLCDDCPLAPACRREGVSP